MPLRKSSRTSLKRRITWDEEKPNMDVYNVPHASAGPSHNDVEELASSEGQRPAKRSEKVSQVPIGGGLLIKKDVF